MTGYSRVPAFFIGVGLGGLAEGVVFHQIVQWHNMGSTILPPDTMQAMRQNMAWDGWFHVGSLAVVLIGIYLLLNDARLGRQLPTFRTFTGLLLLGWGSFNFFEAVINHHLLQLHHVRDIPAYMPVYDGLYLGIGGAGFVLLGHLLSRGERAYTRARL